jgi:hypothetical protein
MTMTKNDDDDDVDDPRNGWSSITNAKHCTDASREVLPWTWLTLTLRMWMYLDDLSEDDENDKYVLNVAILFDNKTP